MKTESFGPKFTCSQCGKGCVERRVQKSTGNTWCLPCVRKYKRQRTKLNLGYDWAMLSNMQPDEAVKLGVYQEYSKEHVIHILMARDNVDLENAIETVQECIDELMEAAEKGDIFAAQDIVQDNLGLEPDYIEGLIGGY